jgi:hypothetical protein
MLCIHGDVVPLHWGTVGRCGQSLVDVCRNLERRCANDNAFAGRPDNGDGNRPKTGTKPETVELKSQYPPDENEWPVSIAGFFSHSNSSRNGPPIGFR